MQIYIYIFYYFTNLIDYGKNVLSFHNLLICLYAFIPLPRNRTNTKKKALTLKQRIFMLLLVGVIGFFTLIIIMAKLGRASAESDPNLDPMLNPNIRVGNK